VLLHGGELAVDPGDVPVDGVARADQAAEGGLGLAIGGVGGVTLLPDTERLHASMFGQPTH
jgi:hypothetical protein